jgi:DNA repair ATPase RecN
MNSHGLVFKKFDFHLHTPASSDYKEKTITADQIVDTAISKGLTGIAVTDHHSAAWIDIVKAAAKPKGLVVFPGAEILATGGKSGVHVLAIFNVDKNVSWVTQFLTRIGVKFDAEGKLIEFGKKTVPEIAEELEKYDPTAILLLAHCHSSKGVTGDIQGEVRKNIFEKRFRCLLGAEANESDFKNADKQREHSRVIDVLNGKDPNFHFRKLGVFQSSDAHNLKDIGNSFTYFKVDQYVTIEDIRQCLVDRDVRIRQSFEYVEHKYPTINSLKIDSGFLKEQTFTFHQGLNSILGAKGAGKSLAIECLRFGLDQISEIKEIREDSLGKLDKQLQLHGTVSIEVSDESGKRYRVERRYNPANGNPIIVTDIGDGSKKDFKLSQVFPVLILSQNEVIRIVEDKTGSQLRRFIDAFFDFHHFHNEIETASAALSDTDSRFAETLRAHLQSLEIGKKIATYTEQIEKINRQIISPVFQTFSRKEAIGRQIQAHIADANMVLDHLCDAKANLDSVELTEVVEDDKPEVKRAASYAQQVKSHAQSGIDVLIKSAEVKLKPLTDELEIWQKEFEPLKAQFDAIVKESGGTQAALDQKRRLLVEEQARLLKELTQLKSKAAQLMVVADGRKKLIEKLESVLSKFTEARKARCDHFSNASNGKLRVTLKEQGDTSNFKRNLMQVKRGSWLKEDDIDLVTTKVKPNDFVRALINYEYHGRIKKEDLQDTATKTGMKIENIIRLADHLLEELTYEQILSIVYTSIAEDIPEIQYKVHETYKPLSELSVGQKAVALLIIALSDGTFPIVIDQPEDSLDLRTIWDDVCSKLRDAKEARQFIFTTHNSSVAVASDTDKFTVLRADATAASIVYSGSLNNQPIRKEVLNYLEGGDIPYDLKKSKYNL